MTSKNLFFKLMKEDLRSRIWALALIGIGFFFLYPVTVAFLAGEIKDYPIYEQGLLWYRDQIQTWLSFENGMMVLVMAVAGLVCGLSGFSYLNSRSKVDFYHSLPVRREMFFAVNFVDGIVILALPYAISLALGVVLAIGNVFGDYPGRSDRVWTSYDVLYVDLHDRDYIGNADRKSHCRNSWMHDSGGFHSACIDNPSGIFFHFFPDVCV